MTNTLTVELITLQEIELRLKNVKTINALWRQEVESLTEIIKNQMEILSYNPNPDAASIAVQTKLITNILLERVNCDDFETIEYLLTLVDGS